MGKCVRVVQQLLLNKFCDFIWITKSQHYWCNNSTALIFDLRSVKGNSNAWLQVASARVIMNIHNTHQGHYLPEVLCVILESLVNT